MSNPKDSDNNPSRLKRHLAILGLLSKAEQPPESSLSDERKLIAAVGDLPDLDFSAQKKDFSTGNSKENERIENDIRRTRRAIWGGAIAMAAAISLMIVLQDGEDDPGFRIKGDLGTTRIYVEQGGKVQEFSNSVVVTEGTKVRVQIIALKDLQAALILLDDKQSVDAASAKAAPRLNLKAGQTAAFPGSLELYGVNDHETVLTVLCPTENDADSLLVNWTLAFNQRKEPDDDKGCQFSYVRLR